MKFIYYKYDGHYSNIIKCLNIISNQLGNEACHFIIEFNSKKFVNDIICKIDRNRNISISTFVFASNVMSNSIINYLRKNRTIENKMVIIKDNFEKYKNYDMFFKKINKLSLSVIYYDDHKDKIYDSKRYLNIEFVNSIRELEELDMFISLSGEVNKFLCHNRSCLGNTFFIDDLGNVKFCYKEDNFFTNLLTGGSFDDVTKASELVNILEKSISKRNECKKTCVHFNKCCGGCFHQDKINECPKEIFKKVKCDIENKLSSKIDSNLSKIRKDNIVLGTFLKK